MKMLYYYDDDDRDASKCTLKRGWVIGERGWSNEVSEEWILGMLWKVMKMMIDDALFYIMMHE